MSWDPYIAQLTAGGFYKGCIAGHNGQIWGTTPNLKLASGEVQALSAVFSDDADALGTIKSRGFTIQGRPYALSRLDSTDDDLCFLVGRCKEQGGASRGVIAARTQQTIIIGVHDPVYAEGMSFGKGHVAIFQLAESLAAMNF